MSVAGVLLAAGSSRRMGHPKSLLPYRGTTLLRHAAQTLCASDCGPKFVVLGPEAEKSSSQVRDLDVALVENPDHLLGLSTSLRAALRAIEEWRAPRAGSATETIDGLLVTLVDQPLVTAGHLDAILEAGGETGLAATSWKGTFGAPVFLHRSFFPLLDALRGDEGAKQLLRARRAQVRLVEFPGAGLDVDDAADYERLLSGAKA